MHDSGEPDVQNRWKINGNEDTDGLCAARGMR